jgi:hypothetical protein
MKRLGGRRIKITNHNQQEASMHCKRNSDKRYMHQASPSTHTKRKAEYFAFQPPHVVIL